MTKDELMHSNIRYRGTSVINMLFHGHCFKDTCCYMPATLGKLCEDFRVKCPKLEEFSYEGKVLSNMELCMYKENLTFEQFMNLKAAEPEFWQLYDHASLLSIVEAASQRRIPAPRAPPAPSPPPSCVLPPPSPPHE